MECPDCGKEQKQGTSFCKECGYPLYRHEIKENKRDSRNGYSEKDTENTNFAEYYRKVSSIFYELIREFLRPIFWVERNYLYRIHPGTETTSDQTTRRTEKDLETQDFPDEPQPGSGEEIKVEGHEHPSNLFLYLTTVASILMVGLNIWTIFTPTPPTTSPYFWLNIAVFFLVWYTLPIFLYYDIKRIQDLTDWRPERKYWVTAAVLLPLFNGYIGLGYVLRRIEKINNRASWNIWWTILALSFLMFESSKLISFLEIPNSFIQGSETIMVIFALVAIPLSIKYDIEYITDRTNWKPNKIMWVGAAIISILTGLHLELVVIPAYLIQRYRTTKANQ